MGPTIAIFPVHVAKIATEGACPFLDNWRQSGLTCAPNAAIPAYSRRRWNSATNASTSAGTVETDGVTCGVMP
jgi:hypothetical protein